MNTRTNLLIVVIVAVVAAPAAMAGLEPSANDVARDRVTYQRLLRDLRTVDAEYLQVLQQATVETQNDGKASLDTKSQLLSATNKRDRLMDRITLVALRHGWDIPDGEPPSGEASPVPDDRQRIFAPADQMIQDKFARDARRIVAVVNLPLIPIESVRKDMQAAKTKEKKWLIF